MDNLAIPIEQEETGYAVYLIIHDNGRLRTAMQLDARHLVTLHHIYPIFATLVDRDADKGDVTAMILLLQFLEMRNFRTAGCTPCGPYVDIHIFPLQTVHCLWQTKSLWQRCPKQP